MRLIKSAEAEWYEILPGIRVLALPLLSGLHEEAMQSLIDAGLVNTQQSDDADRGLTVSEAAFGLAWAKAVARLVIVDWQGIDEPDGSAPSPVTPENVEAFLDHPLVYQKFGEAYMARFMLLGEEKNASAPLPNSSSVEGATIASTAQASAETVPA